MNNNALIEKIETLVKPIADELNYEIYHIEFVKENNEFYLRIDILIKKKAYLLQIVKHYLEE